MSRTVSIFLLAVIMILTLSSCGSGKNRIEDHEWKMRSIIHVEDNQVVYDATSEESSVHPEARVIDMTLVASNGKITIVDATNHKIYEGTYAVSGKNPRGTEYHITIDGKGGNAGVAMTTYADGIEEPTLPISIGIYSMYFYAK